MTWRRSPDTGVRGGWLDRWRAAGERLERERWQHVEALDDDTAWEEAQALLALVEPEWTAMRVKGSSSSRTCSAGPDQGAPVTPLAPLTRAAVDVLRIS